jgi:hypothetical protein
MDATTINTLVAVRLPSIARFRENLSKDPKLKVTVVTNEQAARDYLNDPQKRADVFVVDNGLGNVYELVKELRQQFPRLLILLVDEEADFGMPGRADDVTTEPFKEDDLIKKIKRLAEERRLDTLRADALPPVRNFAKALRKANKGLGKQQAAVAAIKELGYDYVAFYSVNATEPPSLSLGAQVGSNAIMSMIPVRSEYTGLLGWVAQNGQSKIIGPGDELNHLLIEKGRMGAAVGLPVGSTLRFGVVLACREQPGTIKAENIMMLELVCAQLASALAREQRS